jgi:hypothetical protein
VISEDIKWLGRFAAGDVYADVHDADLLPGRKVGLTFDGEGHLVVSLLPDKYGVQYTWPRGRFFDDAALLAWRYLCRHIHRRLKERYQMMFGVPPRGGSGGRAA